MITLDMFTNEFEKIAASFGRNISSKNLLIWFGEVKDRVPIIFKKTCEKLKYGEKLPSFGMFRSTYQEMESQEAIGFTVHYGCQYCHFRMVVWEEGEHSFSGRCKFCFGAGFATVDPLEIIANPKLKLISQDIIGNKYVPREAVRALFKLIASGQTDLADITPNEAMELAEGLAEAKPQYSKKDRARAANIWKSEKAEREATEFAVPF